MNKEERTYTRSQFPEDAICLYLDFDKTEIIENRIQEEINNQGRIESWVMDSYNRLRSIAIKKGTAVELNYRRFNDIRKNRSQATLSEIVFLAAVLELDDPKKLLVMTR